MGVSVFVGGFVSLFVLMGGLGWGWVADGGGWSWLGVDMVWEWQWGMSSGVFVMVLFMVVSMVGQFSWKYMMEEVIFDKFMYMVGVFVLGMVVYLVFSDWFFMLVGWELLGVISFVLIFYYSNVVGKVGSFMTVMVNRVGDVAFILMLVVGVVGGSGWVVMVGVIVCMVTKSAQYPFSFWLPMAMAAPTPVSALVHSSTLVTAGVYMGMRLVGWCSEEVLGVVVLVGVFTVGFAGVSSLWEEDYKKVVALSTLFHLGIMVMLVGLGLVSVGFFHLINHAFYKSVVFVVVGLGIFWWSHEQDLRLVGAQWRSGGGVLGVAVLVGVVSLMGVPYFSGGVTKEVVLYAMFSGGWSMVGVIVFLVGVSCSVGYSVKLLGGSFSSSWGYRSSFDKMGSGLSGFVVFILGVSLVSGWFGVQYLVSGVEGVAVGLLEYGLYWVVGLCGLVVMVYVSMVWLSSGMVLKDLWGVVWSYVVLLCVGGVECVESSVGYVSGVGVSCGAFDVSSVMLEWITSFSWCVLGLSVVVLYGLSVVMV
uniref:NADH:ubiquinone reductase (H(+)-translocating) n=1 Tax=Polyacanthorhynchus caballeroi TaxID=178082 RepID=A0A140DJ78_9BILA|nr:NADH dehydrogenase subunit 5 [Polyacanthorhynchus caballeroi]AMK47832.1 NADH dehydrogenase subunit 5 [Polyacanthorhynchus caballeroi]